MTSAAGTSTPPASVSAAIARYLTEHNKLMDEVCSALSHSEGAAKKWQPKRAAMREQHEGAA